MMYAFVFDLVDRTSFFQDHMRDVIRVITDEEDWVQVKIACYLLEPLLDTSHGVYPRKGGFLTGVDWEWVKPFWIGSVEGYLEDILDCLLYTSPSPRDRG